MKREKIKLSNKEFCDIYYGESEQSIYELVEEETIYTDLEKAYENKEIILYRRSDNKFFKFEEKFSSDGHYSLHSEVTGRQVFAKIIESVIYE